jgi:hypothetical protein
MWNATMQKTPFIPGGSEAVKNAAESHGNSFFLWVVAMTMVFDKDNGGFSFEDGL